MLTPARPKHIHPSSAGASGLFGAMAAPAPCFEDDWSHFSAFRLVSDLPQKGRLTAAQPRLLPGKDNDGDDEADLPPGETGTFRSTGDLAKIFDEKLSACFRTVSPERRRVGPVIEISEESLLEGDDIWNALTSNYGRVIPVDWKQSQTRSLQVPVFKLENKPRKRDFGAELSGDEELREQLDMHSIIVSCLAEEPLFTADQVIEEIEEMMQDSPDMAAKHNLSRSGHCFNTNPNYEDRVRTMDMAELNEHLEEKETSIRRFSEELVQQLALRDELDFEKEVKNSFISALINIQNRQKEHRELLRKKNKLKGGTGTLQGFPEKTQGSRFSMEGLSSVIQNSFRQTFGSGCTEKQYLTTVIPYEKKGHPPSIEDLQVLTKILQAMREDSDKVPSLLTDYILKVLCPT